MKELLTAIANVKKEVGKLSKTETNPFYNSKYFDINSLIHQLEPLLEKNGLLLLQPIEGGFVRSVIYHLETQQLTASEIKLPEMNDPQKLGSAITYYRRYTLQSLLGLQAEDDDGNNSTLQTRITSAKNLNELQAVWESMNKSEQTQYAKLVTQQKSKLK